MDKEITRILMRIDQWMKEAELHVEQRISLLTILTDEAGKLHEKAKVGERILQQLYLKKALGGSTYGEKIFA